MTLQEERAALFELHQRCHARPRTPPWVSIGEAGLDFRPPCGSAQKTRQIAVLREQIILATRARMPLTLHCVRAWGPLLQLLRELKPPPSILHGFSGKPELARQLCGMGHYLSVGPMVTREGAKHLRSSLSVIPPERLLLESDLDDPTAPIGDPYPLLDVARHAAKLVGKTPADLLHQCHDNACRVLGRRPDTLESLPSLQGP